MRSIVLIFLAMNGVGQVLAQSIQFDKAIDYNNRVDGADAFVAVNNDTFIIFSSGFDLEDPLRLYKDVFTKVTSEGEVVDQNIFFEDNPFSYSIYLDNAHLSSSGNYVYTIGRKRDTVSQYQGFDLYIMKLNLEGDTIWTKLHQRPDTSEILSDCIMLPGDSMVCAGYTVNNLNEDDVNYDVWAVMLDSKGNIIKEVDLAVPGHRYTVAVTMVPAFDGNGYSLCGFNANSANSYTKIWRLDSNFSLQLEKTLNLAISNYMFRHTSGHYLVMEELQFNRQNDSHYPDSLTMYNSNWEKIWGVTIPDSGDKQYWVDMTELDDGSMLFCGWGYSIRNEYANLIKISRHGEILWQRRYFDEKDILRTGRLNGLHIDHENNWIYGWGTTLKDPSGSDAWFVRFDSMGCLTPGCDSIDTGIPLPLSEADVPIYPNPVQDVLYVDLRNVSKTGRATMQLFDVSGKLVHNDELRVGSIHRINIAELPSGNYEVLIIEDSERLVTEKLIKN